VYRQIAVTFDNHVVKAYESFYNVYGSQRIFGQVFAAFSQRIENLQDGVEVRRKGLANLKLTEHHIKSTIAYQYSSSRVLSPYQLRLRYHVLRYNMPCNLRCF